MSKHIVYLILVTCSFLLSEETVKKTVTELSNNSKYKVQSTGFYYDGLASPLDITLIRNESDTLWSKTLESALPCVSNSGIVATTLWPKIIFYNYIGDKIWKYSFENRFRYYVTEFYSSDLVDAFSEDDSCYYVVVEDEQHEIFIVKIILFKGEVFKQNFKGFHPCNLYPYIDKLIVHEFCFGMSNYTNKAYVLDEHGKIINETQYDLKSPDHLKKMYFHTNKDTVYFYFKNRENIETIKALYLGN